MNRKRFLHYTLLTTAGLAALPTLSSAQGAGAEPLPAEKVKEFVGAGHGNFDRVKAMLAEMPALIYAALDWKDGDFETAVEAAGHVGHKEIATYLIERGARTNLFVLTMLGNTALVKAYLELYPQYLKARGPHGLTLLHHALKGGEEAKELADYFQAKGLTEMKMAL